VWAKTGNMNYASGLSGYIFKEGKRYIFSLLMNDENKRKITDEAPMKKSRENVGAIHWRKIAMNAQDAILQNWIIEL
jgi:D-alanyl-D-alanine carboxypeptidase